MKFDKKEILALADLAKLHLTLDEVKLYQRQLADILTYVDKIKQVKLGKKNQPIIDEQLGLTLRADNAKAGEAQVFSQAHQIDKGYLVAPNVFQK